MAISKVIYKSSSSATPVTWMDATPATASAADIIAPKTAMLADGVMTEGTGSGGGYTLQEVIEGTITGDIVYGGTKLRSCQFMQASLKSFTGLLVTGYVNDAVSSERATFKNCTTIEGVNLPLFNVTSNNTNMFYGCTALTSAILDSLTLVANGMFRGCASLPLMVFKSATKAQESSFQACTSLTALDFAKRMQFAGGDFTRGCSNFGTLILRGTTLSTITATNVFAYGTKFASGGAGGTIYIPKVLYDHLGDGGSYDYKAASNWSTINGYGTITWEKIEGSYYETHYADGTVIT